MSLIIEKKTLEEVQQSLAAYLPGGPLWESSMIPGTNLNAVTAGLSGLMLEAEVFNRIYNSEFIPSSAGTSYLENWEQTVAIPDNCFPGPAEPDREVRRAHVLVKLASLGVQSAADFERLALLFGKVVTVTSLAESIFPPYDVPFTPTNEEDAPFIILVEGENILASVPPYDVPFDVVSGESIMECLFNKLKPVNCEVLFRNN